MMAAAAPPACDLFVWRDEQDARARAAAAVEVRDLALARYRRAPHGQVLVRLRALQEATENLLRAEAAVADIERKALN
jgi:hypothetical protein